MATALRPIGHEDRLTIVDHLDELRTRLIICAITLAVAFGVCFWQNGALLDVLNKPLEGQHADGAGHARATAASRRSPRRSRRCREASPRRPSAFGALADADSLTPAQRRALARGRRAGGRAPPERCRRRRRSACRSRSASASRSP